MVIKGAKVIINNQNSCADLRMALEAKVHQIKVIHIFSECTADPIYG